MTTVTIRVADVMATQRRQEHFAQMDSGVISPEQRTKGAPSDRRGHKEWEQRIEKDWQSHLESLQQCVCELLLKNQQLRIALMAAKDPERGYRAASTYRAG
jgi:hypothetical protein